MPIDVFLATCEEARALHPSSVRVLCATVRRYAGICSSIAMALHAHAGDHVPPSEFARLTDLMEGARTVEVPEIGVMGVWPPRWRYDRPRESGHYLATLTMSDGGSGVRTLRFDADRGVWSDGALTVSLVSAWMPLPAPSTARRVEMFCPACGSSESRIVEVGPEGPAEPQYHRDCPTLAFAKLAPMRFPDAEGS